MRRRRWAPTAPPRPLDRAPVLDAAEELAGAGAAGAGHRVVPLETRRRRPDGSATTRLGRALTLTGLQAMLDPPRAAATAAVAACRNAGIAVKMITGDHAGTADRDRRAGRLARRAESGTGAVLTGSRPGRAARRRASRRRWTGRRCSPGCHPSRSCGWCEALQARGHVVAMTGDGVNDAPALRQADIGVAMGRSGTEVAKDAADMVLTDDDFATIEAAVEEGRGVFDNLTKFITWTLPTNIGEGLVILAAIAVGAALPILPTQILWINMTTAVALGLMLAFEPKEAGIMTRPPRDPGQPLLTRAPW